MSNADSNPRVPYNSCPPYNYLSGEGLSHAYQGQGYYVPSECQTIPVQNNYKIPPADRPDRIPIDCEDDYVTYVKERDSVTGIHSKNIGIVPCGTPKLMLFGNKRCLPGMPTPEEYVGINALNPTWQPVSRGPRGEYYSYYHEVMERDNEKRRREQPIYHRIQPDHVPTISYRGCLDLYCNSGNGGLN